MLKYSSCAGWHDASSYSWVDSTYYGFRRGENGVFSFRGSTIWDETKLCGRGVAVIGTGL